MYSAICIIKRSNSILQGSVNFVDYQPVQNQQLLTPN